MHRSRSLVSSLLVILSALAVFVLAGGLEPFRVAARAEGPSTKQVAPAALWRRAQQLFEEQRYAEALDLVRDLDVERAMADPQRVRWLRDACVLRLSRLAGGGVDVDADAARRDLIDLLATAPDSVAVRGFEELVRAGHGRDPDVARHSERVLRYWEDSTDLLRAAAGYADLLAAMIESQSTPVDGARLLRMWENLVRSPLPRARLQALGARLLLGEVGDTPQPGRFYYGGGWAFRVPVPGEPTGNLARRVALDLLSTAPPPWLAAQCHYVLAVEAEQQQRFAEAIEHYRAVLEAVDARDARAARQARQRLQAIVGVAAEVQGPALYRPGSEHWLDVRWRNLAGWTLEVDRIDPATRLRLPEQRGGRRLEDFVGPGRAGERVFTRHHDDAREKAAREGRAPEEAHRWRSERLWLESLAPGVYEARLRVESLGEGEASEETTRRVFVVTHWGVITQQERAFDSGRDQLRFWLVDMASGQPRGGVDLDVRLARVGADGRTRQWNAIRGRTGRDGLWTLPLGGEREFFVLGQAGGAPVIVAGDLTTGILRGSTPATRGLVWTDRPLYRPSETVHGQLFARVLDHAERAVRLPADARWQLEIRAPDNRVVFEQERSLDDNGSFEWSFELEEEPPLGRYHVSAHPVGDSSRSIHGGFEVDAYRLPEFEVAVSLDDTRRYVLGDTLGVDLDAHYFFGGGVTGTAEVVVTRRRFEPVWRPWSRMHALVEGPSGAQPWSRRPWMQWPAEEIRRFELPLDENGHAHFELPTADKESDAADYRYTIEARVTDSSRREETGRATLPVTRQELYLYLDGVRHIVAPGDEAHLRLRIQDGAGRPVAHDATWTVTRLQEDDRPERLLFARQTRTGEDGLADLVFRPESTGYYRVRAEGVDGRGNPLQAETHVWCADPRTTRIVHAAGALQLVAEREEFLGDTARVLLVSDVAGADVLLTRTLSTGSDTQVLHLDGTVRLLEFALDDHHRPWFQLDALRVRDWRDHRASIRVNAPPAPKLLDLELRFEHEAYEPGSPARLQVLARDARGRPVSTWLSLAVVDDALLSLRPRPAMQPEAVFYRFAPPFVPRAELAPARWGAFLDVHPESSGDEGGVGLPSPHAPEREESGVRRLGRADGFAPEMAASAAEPMRLKAERDVADAAATNGAVRVRSDFRTTALWRTGVRTGDDGRATLEVPLPESLTRWNAGVLALDPQTRVGWAETVTRTRKSLMVRLQHPRVLREGDRTTFTAIVHNETGEALDTEVALVASDLPIDASPRALRVPAHGRARLEWTAEIPAGLASMQPVRDEQGRLRRVEPSRTRLELRAQAGALADGLRRALTVLPSGTPLHLAALAEVGAGAPVTRTLRLPAARSAALEVASITVSPSMLTACVDALSYLAAFPYGCTEQTLSRFVPAVSVRAVAGRLGVDSRDFDPELEQKIGQGLRRIRDLQHASGGWSWWKEGPDDPYMTSYALVALARAQEAGVSGARALLQRGRPALRETVADLEGRPDDLAYALFALARADEAVRSVAVDDEALQHWREQLYEQRDDLRPYARALLARVFHRYRDEDRARSLLRHLRQQVQRDETLHTAHFGRARGYAWRGEGAVETTAFALAAFVEIEPDAPLREELARWLVLNRRGHRWDSTRATAHAIFALCDHLAGAEQLDPDFTLVAYAGEREVLRRHFGREDLLRSGRFLFDADALADGANALRFEVEGRGRAYVAVEFDTWTRAKGIEAEGTGLEIEREIVRLVPRPTLGGRILLFEEALAPEALVRSGDRLRVRLRLRARLDVDYVEIEDPRPAGCEPIDRSGSFSAGGLWGRREVRDDRVVFFASRLGEGEHVLEYELRAETPGRYAVAPVRVLAMYLAEFGGHGSDGEVGVVDGP